MITPSGEVPGNEEAFSPDLFELYDEFKRSRNLIDFASKNPEGEYKLWLMTRPEDADLRQLSEDLTRRSEKRPLREKIISASSFVIAGAVSVGWLISDTTWQEKVFLGAFTTLPLVSEGITARRNAPLYELKAQKQRAIHNKMFDVE